MKQGAIIETACDAQALALSISRQNIRSEKKGFGQDVAKLIQAKNDYKHDRGPTVLEDIAEASQEVQERLRRCMERLSFFGDYPIRQVEDFNVIRSGDEFFLASRRKKWFFCKGLPRGDLFGISVARSGGRSVSEALAKWNSKED